MMPGTDPTLRANGTLHRAGDDLELRVGELYAHCPKAFVCSKPWRGPAEAPAKLAPGRERPGQGHVAPAAFAPPAPAPAGTGGSH